MSGSQPSPQTKNVFLVNPASDNGVTGKRWPELARRAAVLGLTGEIVAPLAKGAGVLVVADDGYQVDPLD